MTAALTVPDRSLQQRLDALHRANTVRTRRADVKHFVKLGVLDARVLLADPPEWMHGMKVVDLLLAIPRVGRSKAHGALKDCRISPSKTLAGITDRQRAELLAFAINGWRRPQGWRPQW